MKFEWKRQEWAADKSVQNFGNFKKMCFVNAVISYLSNAIFHNLLLLCQFIGILLPVCIITFHHAIDFVVQIYKDFMMMLKSSWKLSYTFLKFCAICLFIFDSLGIVSTAVDLLHPNTKTCKIVNRNRSWLSCAVVRTNVNTHKHKWMQY